MKDGFVKIACACPALKVADCDFNADRIIELITSACLQGVKVVCFPELSITGYTCEDLFFQSTLIDSAEESLLRIAKQTSGLDIVSIVGLPFGFMGKLYNCAAVVFKGDILAIVPKTNIPNYNEFYEARHFSSGKDTDFFTEIDGKEVYFGVKRVFECENMPEFTFGIEICEDLWVGNTPSAKLAENGATVIFNLSASDEIIGKADYRRTIIKAKSGSLLCAYAYADAGIGESTTDLVFSGHSLIVENGSVLAERKPFGKENIVMCDIDVQRLVSERRRCTTFTPSDEYGVTDFSLKITETKLEREFPQTPFVPSDKNRLYERCEEILSIQATGLMTRLRHIRCKDVVLGLSGGLDSTLALIVTVRAFDMSGLDRKGIHTITMPCFGTTDRTYNNACALAKEYGSTLEEINIKESVGLHFKDISHNPDVHDVTYENSQARERTQVLMDKANQYNGIVIGTGDLSELALGWATYNGDHMSMYGVNCSIPKTLVRYLVAYEAENSSASAILKDILDTPVSPELIPAENGNITQKTEDLVGPYELHDFFLYYFFRFGYSPKKILRIAKLSFDGKYDEETIKKWLKTFIKRFFSQQFKRSCLPDGCKVGSVTLSPRGDLRMPSDAVSALWLKELE
ncbi:MAG: NAD(+) synthase [Oscillospiraceae bacterium]